MIHDEQTYQLIHDYLNGNLNAAERKAFELRMNEEPSFAEEVRISKDMYSNLGEEGWNPGESADSSVIKNYHDFLVSAEASEYANTFQKAQSAYDKNNSQRTISMFLLAVASVSIILISTFLYLQVDPAQDLETFYTWNNIPSLTERSENTTSMGEVEQLFLAKKYEKALGLLRLSLDSANGDINTYIYSGICQLELGRYEEALTTFEQLSQSNLLDKGKAHWYLALTYLKIGKKEKAQEQLDDILRDENNFFYQEAQELNVLID